MGVALLAIIVHSILIFYHLLSNVPTCLRIKKKGCFYIRVGVLTSGSNIPVLHILNIRVILCWLRPSGSSSFRPRRFPVARLRRRRRDTLQLRRSLVFGSLAINREHRHVNLVTSWWPALNQLVTMSMGQCSRTSPRHHQKTKKRNSNFDHWESWVTVLYYKIWAASRAKFFLQRLSMISILSDDFPFGPASVDLIRSYHPASVRFGQRV